MKKLLFVIILFFLVGFTAEAQKKGTESIQELITNGAYFEFIYGGQSAEETGIRIRVVDRHRQYVAMGYARTSAKAKDSDPLNYWVKLIRVPESEVETFKQAETLEENALAEDGISVLIVRYKDLQEAALIWYQ